MVAHLCCLAQMLTCIWLASQAVCFLRPTRENVARIRKELRSPRYGEYHLCEPFLPLFTPLKDQGISQCVLHASATQASPTVHAVAHSALHPAQYCKIPSYPL